MLKSVTIHSILAINIVINTK